MTHRIPRPASALLVGAVLAATLAPTHVAAESYGPSAPYTQVLHGQYDFVPLPDAAMINRSKYGYIYRAGQQDSNLVVTEVDGKLRLHDKGTQKFKSLPDSCRRQAVSTGVAAVCTVPSGTSTSNHMLLEIWPRLGDDHVDASSLPAVFDVTVLADAGVDVVRMGAGNDFVNGAFDADWVSGGAGNDWIRTGTGNDEIRGNKDSDLLVGSDHRDTMRGGYGDDEVRGGNGNDLLYGQPGRDLVACGTGADSAHVDAEDRVVDCESRTFG